MSSFQRNFRARIGGATIMATLLALMGAATALAGNGSVPWPK